MQSSVRYINILFVSFDLICIYYGRSSDNAFCCVHLIVYGYNYGTVQIHRNVYVYVYEWVWVCVSIYIYIYIYIKYIYIYRVQTLNCTVRQNLLPWFLHHMKSVRACVCVCMVHVSMHKCVFLCVLCVWCVCFINYICKSHHLSAL